MTILNEVSIQNFGGHQQGSSKRYSHEGDNSCPLFELMSGFEVRMIFGPKLRASVTHRLLAGRYDQVLLDTVRASECS